MLGQPKAGRPACVGHIVAPRLLRCQAHGGHVGGQALGDFQCAPVEALQRHAAAHAVLIDDGQHASHERFRRRRQVGFERGELGFDVEADRAVAAATHLLEQRGECGNALAVNRPLLREALRIAAVGAQPADVVGLHFGQAQAAKRSAWAVDPAPARVASDVGIQARLVRNHHHAVLGQHRVELQRVDADRCRRRERAQRVFRCQAARAAMALQIERSRGAGQQAESDAAGDAEQGLPTAWPGVSASGHRAASVDCEGRASVWPRWGAGAAMRLPRRRTCGRSRQGCGGWCARRRCGNLADLPRSTAS